MNWQFDEMACEQNSKLIKWVEKMISTQNCKLIYWQVDEMAS